MTVGVLICNLCQTLVEPAPGQSTAISDVCPHCKLRSRHRAMGAYLDLVGDRVRNGRVLACGMTPPECDYLLKGVADPVNFDIRPLKYLNRTMDIQQMSEIASASYDVFVAVHVLNHVRDDLQAIAEIARVLEPRTGLFLATIPFRRASATEELPDPTDPYGPEALAKYGVGSFRRYGLGDFQRAIERWFLLTEFAFSDPLTGREESVFQARRLR
jgi:SAM-dependent methyltransferase